MQTILDTDEEILNSLGHAIDRATCSFDAVMAFRQMLEFDYSACTQKIHNLQEKIADQSQSTIALQRELVILTEEALRLERYIEKIKCVAYFCDWPEPSNCF